MLSKDNLIGHDWLPLTKLPIFVSPYLSPTMPKISFFLKDNNADKDTAIILYYTCSDGRLKYYTGESIHPDDWPDRVGKGTRSQLRRLETSVEHLAIDYKIKGDRLTKEIVKRKLDLVRNKKVVEPVTNLFEQMSKVVDLMEAGKLQTPGKKKYAKLSIKTFRFTIEFLRTFDPALKLSTIDLSTYARFITYCQGLDYSTNYIGSQIKNWKTLCKAIGGNNIFDDPGFKKIQEETFDIYLDEKELATINNLTLVGRFAVIRDWFILDCYTGLRVSDLVILSKKNYSHGFITIANEKTDEKVVIPVHPFVKQILDRYKGFPPSVSDVEINREIKLIAEKAKINGNVLFTITKGGKRKDEYLKKWQMVSCHTARRSFITNLRKNGVPDSIVMKLAGIKSAATLTRYDKLGADEAAKIAAGLKFFK